MHDFSEKNVKVAIVILDMYVSSVIERAWNDKDN